MCIYLTSKLNLIKLVVHCSLEIIGRRNSNLFYSNNFFKLLQENDPGMYTLLCLDATDASRHSNTRQMLHNLYKDLLQGKFLP